MGGQGPCCHCGIGHTPLWRGGPPEKPVLCNACGSRWKARGTLQDYIPKHSMKAAQSSRSQLFPKQNTTSSIPTYGAGKPKFLGSNVFGPDQPSFVFGSNVVGHDQPPFVFGVGANYGSGSKVAVSSSISRTQNVQEEMQASIWDSNNVSRKKRSTLEQRVLSPTERLHQQLVIAMEEQSDDDDDDPESLLIFERINKYIPENEIGLGCMLLQPPPSPTKESKAVGGNAAAAASSAKRDSKMPIENKSNLVDSHVGESSE